MPDKPVKHAVAAAIYREGASDEILAVQRPDEPGEELPGIWGLPATTLMPDEAPEQAILRLGREKIGVQLGDIEFISEGWQEREHYVLHLSLYRARILAGEPAVRARPHDEANRTYYVDCRWMPPDGLLEGARRGSLCCQLLTGRYQPPSD